MQEDASEPDVDGPVAQALEQSFAVARRWLDPSQKVAHALEECGVEPQSDRALPARLATAYFLDYPLPGQRVTLTKWPFGEEIPLHPRDHSPSVALFWESLARRTKIPALSAILFDLLAQRGGKFTPIFAYRAICSYCDLADRPQIGLDLGSGETKIVTWEASDIDLGLARALALAQYNPRSDTPGAVDQLDRATNMVFSRILSLARSGEAPGILIMLAEQLHSSRHVSVEIRSNLVDTLVELFNHLPDPHLVDSIGSQLKKLRALSSTEVDTRRVAVRIAQAETSQAMVAMSVLQEAQNLARDLGLADLAREATLKMQSLRSADFGWESISTETVIGRELIEGQGRIWSRGSNWAEALRSWSQSGAPTGDLNRSLEFARERVSENRLINSLERTIYGADGLPQLVVSTTEQRVEYELYVGDQMSLQLYGDILAQSLTWVARFGVPKYSAVLGWLAGAETEFRPIWENLANALLAYWNEDYDRATMESIFHIESSLRQLALLLDQPAYVAVRRGQRGKYVGIEQLLSLLKTLNFDPDWAHAITAFCLGPYGFNVRNDIAHGFAPSMSSRARAALSIRFLLLVVMAGGKPDGTRVFGAAPQLATSTFRVLEHNVRLGFAEPELIAPLVRREARDLVRVTRVLANRLVRRLRHHR